VTDARDIVRAGYERLGNTYWEWSRDNDPQYRERYIGYALDVLAPDSLVVELGSGSGVPVARMLSGRHRLVCVDFAHAQLELVAANAPDAKRLCADMSTVQFAPASVDAVVAFYSIIHVPREHQAGIFASIVQWLRPGGLFVASMGARDSPSETEEWIGVPMFWSTFDADTNLAMIGDAGLEVVRSEILLNFEDGREVRFLWVVAQKPSL
jgi:SAM-dependent methyltransferase